MKKIIFILVVIIIAIGCSACGDFNFGFEMEEEFTPSVVPVEDLYIPEKVDTDLFGLFFYNEDGTLTRSTEDINKINFDPNKPLILFIEGILMDYGYKNLRDMPAHEYMAKDSGYNCAVFAWGPFSDENSPGKGRDKVWGVDGSNRFRIEDENGNPTYIEDDPIKQSMSEFFVSYYVDFMKRAGDFNGNKIHFTGLSAGSNCLFAISYYMLLLEEAGKIDSSIIPDKLTYFDAYLDGGVLAETDVFCSWLNEPLGKGGSGQRALESLRLSKERGIAVEYVESTSILDLIALTDLDDPDIADLSQKIKDETAYLVYNHNHGGVAHVLGKFWYYECYSEKKMFEDNTNLDGESVGVSLDAPIPYMIARRGAYYTMDKNPTQYYYEDDNQYSNVSDPIICGLAFLDVNDNGIHDERIANRVADVEVTLLDSDDNIVSTTKTNKGGYYQFLMGEEDMGKDFYIKVKINGYEIGKADSGEMFKMGNNMNKDFTSDLVTVSYENDIKVINIGLTK